MRHPEAPQQPLGGTTFDPTKVSQELVTSAAHAAGVPQRALRRLGGEARKLADAKQVLGIVAVSLTGVLEVFVQLQVLFNDFSMPLWMWTMLVFPALGAGGAECGIWGLDDWCSFFVGAMGLNVLQLV